MASPWFDDEPVDVLLRRVRSARGMSQYRVAEALREASGNVCAEREYVHRWEAGKRIPTPYWRQHLATVLDIPLEVLDRACAAAAARRDQTRIGAPEADDGPPRTANEILRAAPRSTTPATADHDAAARGDRDVPLDFAADDEVVVALIEGYTAGDVATRRDVLKEMSVLAGAALTEPLRQWASLPPLLPAHARQVGTPEIQELEQVVPLFRRWDAAAGGGVRRKAVVGQLNAVCETLRRQRSPQIRRLLFQIAAELAQIAGWMSYDSRLYGAAQRYYLLGLHACQQSDARDLGAKIIGDLTQMSTALGRYDDSLELTRTAIYSLPRRAATVVRSELLGLEARAYAHLPGEETGARRAVDACLEAYDDAATQPRPDWVHYMTQAEADCLAANTHIELALAATDRSRARHHAGRAEHHTRRSMDARGQTYTRSRVLDLARLAKVRIAQHEPAEATQVASQAIDLATGLASSVAVEWLLSIHATLTARYADAPDVTTFTDRMRGYLRDAAPEREYELVAN